LEYLPRESVLPGPDKPSLPLQHKITAILTPFTATSPHDKFLAKKLIKTIIFYGTGRVYISFNGDLLE
jgi:hypothetical protein